MRHFYETGVFIRFEFCSIPNIVTRLVELYIVGLVSVDWKYARVLLYRSTGYCSSRVEYCAPCTVQCRTFGRMCLDTTNYQYCSTNYQYWYLVLVVQYCNMLCMSYVFIHLLLPKYLMLLNTVVLCSVTGVLSCWIIWDLPGVE